MTKTGNRNFPCKNDSCGLNEVTRLIETPAFIIQVLKPTHPFSSLLINNVTQLTTNVII